MKAAYVVSEDTLNRLNLLLNDPEMITFDAYSPDTASYPTNRISFVEQHVRYLKAHKNVDPSQYISNLELMIKRV